MRIVGAGRAVMRGLAAIALAATVAGAATIVAVPTVAAPAVTGPTVPTPAEVVRETGSWVSHGYTLDLRPDGSGLFAAWVGAFDGTRIQLRLIPAPGSATVAEVTAIEKVGAGALGADEVPGVGGLVTIAFGDTVRTAHVEWSSGPRRLVADLCPTEGLDAAQMAVLRCGA